MIRVLRIVTRLNVGGPSKQISTLNAIFEEDNFDQVILVGNVQEIEHEVDVTFFRNLIRIKTLRRGLNLILDTYTLFKVVSNVRKYKPHIIHTHMSKAWALSILAKPFISNKIRFVHTFHGHILHSYFSWPKEFTLNRIQIFLAKNTDLLVAVNKTVRSDLINKGIGKNNVQILIFGFGILFLSFYGLVALCKDVASLFTR